MSKHNFPIQKTEAEWRAQLSHEAYQVTREKGTEPAFTGCFWDTKTEGTYACICCNAPLFTATTKFDSGSGWPSFWEPVSPEAILEETDSSYGMVRSEILCAQCGAHLGHVFTDGPKPTGLRYCVNSASLILLPTE